MTAYYAYTGIFDTTLFTGKSNVCVWLRDVHYVTVTTYRVTMYVHYTCLCTLFFCSAGLAYKLVIFIKDIQVCVH